MSFMVHPINGDKWGLVFSDEPDYIHALQMAPETMEPELGSGLWLIVAFPLWSGPVRDSVRAAVACAKKCGGKIHLGVRPFDYHDEFIRWWPGDEIPAGDETTVTVQDTPGGREVHITADNSAVPTWLILKDGQVAYQGTGPRSEEQLDNLVREVAM